MRTISLSSLVLCAHFLWCNAVSAQSLVAEWTGDMELDGDSCVAFNDILQILSEWSGAASISLDADGDGLSSCPDLIAALDALGGCGTGFSLGNRCGIVGALNFSPGSPTHVGCIFPGAIPESTSCPLPPIECPQGGPCEGTCVVDYGGTSYATVEIGNQCWFVDNLQTTTFADGSSIPGEQAGASWQTASVPLQCAFGNDENSVATHGRLYNGFAVLDARGLCPSGWHVPTDAEFQALEAHLGMSSDLLHVSGWRSGGQGKALKASPGEVPGWNGTNESGLALLPGGFRSGVSGNFAQFGISAFLFSSTPSTADRLMIRYLYILNDGVYRGPVSKSNGYSVRCIKN